MRKPFFLSEFVLTVFSTQKIGLHFIFAAALKAGQGF